MAIHSVAKLLFWVLFIMAAEAGLCMEPGKSTTDVIKEFNIGRAFAHCIKLDKGNYFVWLTGLLSTLAGRLARSDRAKPKPVISFALGHTDA